MDTLARNTAARIHQGLRDGAHRPLELAHPGGRTPRRFRLHRGLLQPAVRHSALDYPFQVLLPVADTGLDRDSKAQAEQVRSIAFVEGLGVVPANLDAEAVRVVGEFFQATADLT